MRIAALLSLALFAACGGEKPIAPDSVGQILHKDAQLVIGFSSIGDADALMHAVSPPGMAMPLSTLLSQLPGAGPGSFREDAPLAFAVSLPASGSDFEFSAAIPATDPDGLAKQFNEGSAKAFGNYVGVSSRESYPECGCALWSGLPKGDMVGRLDLAALGGTANPMVDLFLRQAGEGSRLILGFTGAAIPGFDAEETAQDFESWLREVVDSGERLDLVIDLDATSFRGEVAYTARAGTEFAEAASRRGGLSALAAHAPDGWPYLLLLRLDPAWIASEDGREGDLLAAAADRRGLREVRGQQRRGGGHSRRGVLRAQGDCHRHRCAEGRAPRGRGR